MRSAVLLLLLLSACSHTQMSASNAQSGATGSAQVQAANGIAAAILAGMLVSAAASGDGATNATAPMDPDREIGEQDCTKPVDLTRNLRCR
jgi:hypothetical protein